MNDRIVRLAPMAPDPRVRAVKSRLAAAGVPLQALYPGWVEYWLEQGKTVEQVVQKAFNKKESGYDAYVGGGLA